MDLFTAKPVPPLAELLRPRKVDEVVGQAHLFGPGKPLRLAFESKKLHSFVLWGPPGVGKTTIARLAATLTDSHFLPLSAAEAGVKELRAAMDSAQAALDNRGRPTIVFVDELHRLNKGQQDALLGQTESGLIKIIGATTEHPGMELTSALLSRVQVYTVEPLGLSEFQCLYERARPHLLGVTIDAAALSLLTGYADGDGRRFLNLVEIVANGALAAGIKAVDGGFAKNATSPSLRRFDKSGDELYWQLSAFHKSLRGSQPDAALYWLARILDGGGDGRQVARRMVAMASEDIGNADPRALTIALNALEAYRHLGSPEGDLALAQAATFLASAPKSNASYKAWKLAKAFVRNDGSRPVPLHLRNAPAQLMKDMGYGAEYRYAHNEPGAYAAGQNYFPEGMAAPGWYQPSERGLEAKIGERLTQLKALDAQAVRKGLQSLSV